MAEDVFGIVGSVIAGAYHVEEVVAEGGFGVVYRAHHGGFRAPVALKLLKVPPQSSEQQAAFLELFRSEAELLFRLSASLPTVVRPLHVDAFTASDGSFVPYIVLEWLEGMTLDSLIKQRNRDGLSALPLRKLVRLLTPVARALERAHNFSGPEGFISIVHRDLKPENIFVAQVAGEEVVKILDFGIGKVKSVASQVAGRMSQDGHAPTAFTPAYGAPEQWAPKHFGQTGPWTDVWGLALCMVETLAGRPVIDGDPAAMMGTTLDAARRPTPRTEGVELPDAVEAVFARALALDPRARQPDAGVFWNELLSALQVPDSERGVALPRDARAEEGGGVRVERVEVRSRSSGTMSRVPQPQPSPAAETALAVDLEFDPSSGPPPRVGTVSETRPSKPAPAPVHVVPDLDLAPPSMPRRVSGAHAAVAERPIASPSVLDLDDHGGSSGSLDLDLDLPANEPIARRSGSSQRMPAVQLESRRSSTPARRLSGAMSAVVEPSSSTGGVASAEPAIAQPPQEAAKPARAPQRISGPPASPPSSGALNSGFVAKIQISVPDERSLGKRLRPALGVLGLSISIGIFDPVYAAVTGEVLEVIGVRPSLFAGALLLLSLALGAREVLREP